MLDPEYGIVVRFGGRDGLSNFGFLVVLDEDGQRTKEELFFHSDGGVSVDVVGGEIVLGRDPKWEAANIWCPRVGTKIAFEREEDPFTGRVKATPWTYAEAFDNATRELTEPYYRVIKVTKLGFGGPGDTTEVICEYKRADDLSREYPVRVLSGELSNPLGRSVNFGAGSTTRYLFEVWVDDDVADLPDGGGVPIPGHWRECSDPRDWSERALQLARA